MMLKKVILVCGLLWAIGAIGTKVELNALEIDVTDENITEISPDISHNHKPEDDEIIIPDGQVDSNDNKGDSDANAQDITEQAYVDKLKREYFENVGLVIDDKCYLDEIHSGSNQETAIAYCSKFDFTRVDQILDETENHYNAIFKKRFEQFEEYIKEQMGIGNNEDGNTDESQS